MVGNAPSPVKCAFASRYGHVGDIPGRPATVAGLPGKTAGRPGTSPVDSGKSPGGPGKSAGSSRAYGESGSHAELPDTNDPSLPDGYYGLTLEFCRDPLADHSIIIGTLDEQEMAVHLFEHAPGDLDSDGDVDMEDFQRMQACHDGADEPCEYECQAADLDEDGDVDMDDASAFFDHLSGPDQPPARPSD